MCTRAKKNYVAGDRTRRENVPRPILFYKKLKGPAESAGPFPFLYVSDDIFRLLFFRFLV